MAEREQRADQRVVEVGKGVAEAVAVMVVAALAVFAMIASVLSSRR
jgi:hypothetical protein